MRKLLLTGILFLGLASCQKDYYLDDLKSAESTIQELNSRVASLNSDINGLMSDLGNSNSLLNQATYELSEANSRIQELLLSNNNLYEENVSLIEEIVSIEEQEAQLLSQLQDTQQALYRAQELWQEDVSSLSELLHNQREEIARLRLEIANLMSQIPVDDVSNNVAGDEEDSYSEQQSDSNSQTESDDDDNSDIMEVRISVESITNYNAPFPETEFQTVYIQNSLGNFELETGALILSSLDPRTQYDGNYRFFLVYGPGYKLIQIGPYGVITGVITN